MQTLKNRGLILAVTTALFWGLLAIGLKMALAFFDSYTIVWIRFATAALMMVGYYSVKNRAALNIFKKPPLALVAAALLLGINYIGFMQGVNYSDPATAQILIQLGAVTLGVLGFILFKEKITTIRLVGFTTALIGFAFFYYHQFTIAHVDKATFNKGIVWLVVAAWSWTGYAILSKILVRKHAPQQINMFIYTIPAILFTPLADFASFHQEFPWWIWPLMFFLCINTVIAYGALAEAFKYAEANQISIIITLNPIITFLCLEIMLALNIDWIPIPNFDAFTYIGALLVITGAVVAAGFSRTNGAVPAE